VGHPGEHGPVPDDLLSDYAALNDPEARRRLERQGGHFVVEGPFALDALARSRYPIRSVLASPRTEGRARALLAAAGRADVPVLVVPPDDMARVTGFDFHRGLLASATRLPLPAMEEVTRGARRIAVLESLNDHENLGALFRNARAFGVEAVLLDHTTADPLYRRSVRVSQGHVLHVPWTRTSPWPAALAALKAEGFTLAALSPGAAAIPIEDLAAAPPERLAFLLGAEGPGLTPAARAAADVEVRIPTAPEVDSLNVATAAAIAFHRLQAAPWQP
jgi:tRNA G18 (ribose-2'-O)-methylase SpoU